MAWDESERQRAKELKRQGYTYAGINVILARERQERQRQEIAAARELYRQRRSKPARVRRTYTVKKDDTLSTIADRHGIDVDALLDANPEARTIRAGLVINYIP